MRTYDVVPFTGYRQWQARLDNREIVCGSCSHLDGIHPSDWHVYCGRCHLGFCKRCVVQMHLSQQIWCRDCAGTD